MKQCTYRNFTITIKERDYLHHHPYFLAHLVAYISEHILESTMDNAQGDSPGQPVTCKDPGAELLHMCFWHMDSDFLLAVRVALTKIFHFPIAIRTETCTKTKKKGSKKRRF